MNVQEIISEIQKLPTPAIIGISGFAGSGKSTFAQVLANKLGAQIVEVDAFWKNTTERNYTLWNIVDYARLEREVLIPLSKNVENIEYGVFNWESNSVQEKINITARDIVIIEGVGLFRPELMKYFSYTIWIDCPLNVATERGKKRDREQYRQSHDELWDGLWRENDEQYYNEFHPEKIADALLLNSL